MIALVRRPDPSLPAETPCVECGKEKGEHKKINDRLVCFPLVAREQETGERGLKSSWRTFR